MLNTNALQQLKGLKKQIRDNRDIRIGTYRPARNRFGFVTDDEGNDVFLPPDEATKLLPGDKVEIEVSETDKDRVQGKVLRLIESNFSKCHGHCIERGKGFFIEIDDHSNMWMFVPPKNRKGAKAGDKVSASLLKHPFKNEGKGQLKIDEVLGNNSLPGIETAYAISRFGLHSTWPKDLDNLVESLQKKAHEVVESREVSPYPFVSIDSVSTKDVDDAIYCESTPDGWKLVAAIADPVSLIEKNSPLERVAKKRGATVYFPHGPLSMLPEALSSSSLSLLAHRKRPAVVCEMHINSEGELSDVNFSLKTIVSVAKLSYFQVADYLNHGTIAEELTDPIQHSLAASKMATDAIRASRPADGLMNDQSRVDHRFRLNDAGKIEDVVEIERTSAHELVEEVMLSTNFAAAKFLAEHKCPGPFSVHRGIREERLTESHTLLNELAPNLDKGVDPASTEGFASIKAACKEESAQGLVRPLRRLLSRANIKNSAEPHFGLGFECYTTMTSPLRRYQDLLVHYQLYAIINEQQVLHHHNEDLEQLAERLINNRSAIRQSEAELLAQYAEKFNTSEFEAEVVQMNAKQITLRCNSNGLQGFLPTNQLGKQWKYDALRGKLSNDKEQILLGQCFTVSISATDTARRTINFKLVKSDKKS